MTTTEKTKTRPEFLLTGQGTALGTSSIVETSSFQYMQLMSIHGGTGGSRTVNVYINAGTQKGTASTTLPNPLLVGSRNSDQAGAGTPIWLCGSLTDQAIVTVGTSTDASFSLSYLMLE